MFPITCSVNIVVNLFRFSFSYLYEMDQKPSTSFSVPPIPVTCKILTSQVTSTVVSPSTSNSYILTPSNLRPVQNYTFIPTSQVPNVHRYVVQPNIRPQFIRAGNVRHILSPNTQPTKVTYMLPSGAQIIRMNNVITNKTAGVQRPSTQYILKSSAQKLNSINVSQIGTQSSKTSPIINCKLKIWCVVRSKTYCLILLIIHILHNTFIIDCSLGYILGA